MAQQQYEANHQPGVRPVAAIRDDPIHVVHARNPQLPLQVPNQPIERRQELPSHLDQDVDKWTEFRKFVIRGLKGKTNSFAKTWRTRYTFLVVGLKQSEIIDGVIAAVNAEIQNIPDEYRSTIGEYTCKQCFEYVAEHGQENCQHLIVPNGFHTIRNIKTKPLQHTTLSSHERSRLHKASIGITVTEEDLNVWRAVYASALLNIPYVTHPFIMYLGCKANGKYGKILHGASTAAYITLVLGSMIRSVTFEYIEKALWVSWGLDTGDGCDSKKLLYVFAQVLMKGEPLSMHVGVRGELGATGKELWDMFFALLSGDDLEYGYDVETKIKIECYGQNNRIGWNADEEEEVKNECNESKYVKKMKKLKNLGVKFGMDPRKVIKSTTLNEFIRLQTGGVIPSILSRLQQAEDADDVLIVSNRLQFIQDEIEAYNQRTDDVIEFDPFFTESFVYDTILNHYINEYRTNYTNMELYRKCCDLFVFSKM
eukprot:374014_1